MSVTNRTDIAVFRKTVTTAGTPVQLEALNIPDGFMLVIKALASNTGNILVGRNEADVTGHGFELDASESIGYKITNANVIWIDATISGETVCCSVEQF